MPPTPVPTTSFAASTVEPFSTTQNVGHFTLVLSRIAHDIPLHQTATLDNRGAINRPANHAAFYNNLPNSHNRPLCPRTNRRRKAQRILRQNLPIRFPNLHQIPIRRASLQPLLPNQSDLEGSVHGAKYENPGDRDPPTRNEMPGRVRLAAPRRSMPSILISLALPSPPSLRYFVILVLFPHRRIDRDHERQHGPRKRMPSSSHGAVYGGHLWPVFFVCCERMDCGSCFGRGGWDSCCGDCGGCCRRRCSDRGRARVGDLHGPTDQEAGTRWTFEGWGNETELACPDLDTASKPAGSSHPRAIRSSSPRLQEIRGLQRRFHRNPRRARRLPRSILPTDVRTGTPDVVAGRRIGARWTDLLSVWRRSRERCFLCSCADFGQGAVSFRSHEGG